jgi:hypothetical protein
MEVGMYAFERAELRMIEDAMRENSLAGRYIYEGLSSSDIGAINRACMFGENDEAFPDDETWSMIVD